MRGHLVHQHYVYAKLVRAIKIYYTNASRSRQKHTFRQFHVIVKSKKH